MTRRLMIGGVVWGLLVASAWAAPIVDFGVGPTGPLGTDSLVINGVKLKVRAFGGFDPIELYRYNGTVCFNGDCHEDRGLGALRASETTAGLEQFRQPELNPGETMLITKPDGSIWTSAAFTSVNNGALADLYLFDHGQPITSGSHYVLSASQGDRQTIVFRLEDWALPNLAIRPTISSLENFFLVEGVNVKELAPVPEPATLTLLGVGLLLGRRVWRRGAHSS